MYTWPPDNITNRRKLSNILPLTARSTISFVSRGNQLQNEAAAYIFSAVCSELYLDQIKFRSAAAKPSDSGPARTHSLRSTPSMLTPQGFLDVTRIIVGENSKRVYNRMRCREHRRPVFAKVCEAVQRDAKKAREWHARSCSRGWHRRTCAIKYEIKFTLTAACADRVFTTTTRDTSSDVLLLMVYMAHRRCC